MNRRPNPIQFGPEVWCNFLDRDGNSVRVTLYLDKQAILHQIGAKAATSRGGKSQLMHGAILCKREKK
jgi:hypothetical protein